MELQIFTAPSRYLAKKRIISSRISNYNQYSLGADKITLMLRL